MEIKKEKRDGGYNPRLFYVYPSLPLVALTASLDDRHHTDIIFVGELLCVGLSGMIFVL